MVIPHSLTKLRNHLEDGIIFILYSLFSQVSTSSFTGSYIHQFISNVKDMQPFIS